MRPFARASALALAAALCPALAGCKTKDTGSPADAGGVGKHGLTAQESAQVLARVGDRTITLGDYVEALDHMDSFDRLRYQAPEHRKELLHEMIDVMLLADEAREKGYDKDPVTQQELREILRDAYFEKARESSPAPNDIPEAEVRAFYDAHRADFRDPERRRLSAIVLATGPSAAAALDAAKKASAVEWGQMVRAKSIDPQAKADVPVDLAGDLGFVSPPGDASGDDRGANPRVPDEVRAAAFEVPDMHPGDVLPRVVQAKRKFYLLRLVSRSDAHDRSFAEAERSIRVRLAQDKLVERERALVDDLRKQFPVAIDEAALGQVRVGVPSADAGAN
jgi:DNA-directed RNA polymerase subunit F